MAGTSRKSNATANAEQSSVRQSSDVGEAVVTASAKKRRPVHEIRLGRIKAAIWQNESSTNGSFSSVTVSRIYREGESWKRSSSFNRDDLPLVAKVSDLAHSWIFEHTP